MLITHYDDADSDLKAIWPESADEDIPYLWAVFVPHREEHRFWCIPARPSVRWDFANLFRAGVLMESRPYEDGTIWFLTDNNEDMEASAG